MPQYTALTLTLGVMLSMTTTACAEGSQPVATLRHDLGGRQTLHAYVLEPAAETRQMDRMYGLGIRSPRTPYLCAWRDPGRLAASGAGAAGPGSVFLVCVFGADDWSPPAEYLREAEERMRRDEAVLRAQWDRDGDTYRLTRFEVEIRVRGGGPGMDFRSVNFGDAVAELDMRQAEISFPASASNSMTFRISAVLPRRFNRGEAAGPPLVSLDIAGTAGPTPRWLNY